jgi:hypothetical protein
LTAQGDWIADLRPESVGTRDLLPDMAVAIARLRFSPWVGPPLTMAEDCNKRGGRLVGDAGELSCAEVEIVKRFREAGWQAAWIQAFRCGHRLWSAYIGEPLKMPEVVQRIQRIAGTGGGHPDIVAWKANRVVFIESKGPGDSVKASQAEWFKRAIVAGQPPEDIGLVEWRPHSPAS